MIERDKVRKHCYNDSMFLSFPLKVEGKQRKGVFLHQFIKKLIFPVNFYKN